MSYSYPDGNSRNLACTIVQSGKHGYENSHINNNLINIFAWITAFDPKNWKEIYALPKIMDVALIASLFKYAVCLYALQTLPLPSSVAMDYQTCQNELLYFAKYMMYRPRCILALP